MLCGAALAAHARRAPGIFVRGHITPVSPRAPRQPRRRRAALGLCVFVCLSKHKKCPSTPRSLTPPLCRARRATTPPPVRPVLLEACCDARVLLSAAPAMP